MLEELSPKHQNFASQVEQAILATRHGQANLTQHSSPLDATIALLLDIDLAILGSPTDRYEQYESQVRQEYAWVPAVAFRSGRATLLKGFHAADPLYQTGFFRQRYELRAKENLYNAILALGEAQ